MGRGAVHRDVDLVRGLWQCSGVPVSGTPETHAAAGMCADCVHLDWCGKQRRDRTVVITHYDARSRITAFAQPALTRKELVGVKGWLFHA